MTVLGGLQMDAHLSPPDDLSGRAAQQNISLVDIPRSWQWHLDNAMRTARRRRRTLEERELGGFRRLLQQALLDQDVRM